MSDKGTTGALESEFENLGARLKDKVLARAEGVIEFTGDQLVDLAELTDDIAAAIGGDERAQAHVEAQLALTKFSVEARAYLEAVAFRQALADAILEIVGGIVKVGAKLAGEALAAALLGL